MTLVLKICADWLIQNKNDAINLKQSRRRRYSLQRPHFEFFNRHTEKKHHKVPSGILAPVGSKVGVHQEALSA